MRFKIDWASLIVGSKFTFFALFCFVFEGNFPSTSPRGAYIWRGNLTEGFLGYRLGGLHMEGLIFRILRYLLTGEKKTVERNQSDLNTLNLALLLLQLPLLMHIVCC